MPRLTLRASNTHLYAGARLRASGAGWIVAAKGDAVVIEFADLGVARARVEAVSEGRIHLGVEAHRTRRGAEIAAKRWILEDVAPGADGTRSFRVAARQRP